MQIELFEQLAGGAQDADALAARNNFPRESMVLLLNAAVALDMLERRGANQYGLGQLGAAMRGNPGIAAMVSHHAALYADLADPVALLRERTDTTRLARYWPYSDAQSQQAVTYSALMGTSQPMIADVVLSALSFKGYRCLLDVGGGDGTFLSAIAKAAPRLKLMLFDLPNVAEIARNKLGDRAIIIAGDFANEAIPSGADAITLVRVLHDHDDGVVLALLRKIRDALPRDGTLIIAEPMRETSGAEKVFGCIFCAVFARDGTRSPPARLPTCKKLLQLSGFSGFRRIRTTMPLIASIVMANR